MSTEKSLTRCHATVDDGLLNFSDPLNSLAWIELPEDNPWAVTNVHDEC